MLKYVSQFFLQIFPSVIATVVGAYIVNHYIIPKAGSDAPKAAAYSKAAPGAGDDQGAIDVTPKAEAAAIPDSKPDAKGKAADNKAAEKPVEATKGDIKAATDAKRPAPREKVAVRVVLPPTNETATASIAPTAPAQAEERRDRDVNELARAAIERLRNSGSGEATRPTEPQHAQEPVREPVREAVREAPSASREPARMNVVAVPPAVQPRTVVQPLPPPVSVMPPSVEASVGDVPQTPPLYAPPRRVVDANRLIPPADIPEARPPIDLQPASTRTSVADDVLSAARSVIHTIVPQ